MYSEKKCNDHVYIQILIHHISNLIIMSKFFELFQNLRDINLLEECVNVSCCVELISDVSKI